MRRPQSVHASTRLIKPDRGDTLNDGLVGWWAANEMSGERALNTLYHGAGKIPTGDNPSGETKHAIPQWYGYGEHWTTGRPGAWGGRHTYNPGYGALLIPSVFTGLQKFTLAYRGVLPGTMAFGPTDGSWSTGWAVVDYGSLWIFFIGGYSSNPRVTLNQSDAPSRRGNVSIVATYDQATMRLYVNNAEGSYASGAISIPTGVNVSIARETTDVRIWNRAITRSEALRYINDGPNVGALRSPSRRFAILAGGAGAAALAGDAVATATAAADLTTSITLAGAAAKIATASGALTTAIVLAGDATGLATATGDLGAGAAALASDAVGLATAAADLTTGIVLASDAVGLATATAALTTAIALVGDATGLATATADLGGGAAALASDATATATATADLTTGILIASDATATATATADLGGGAAALASDATATATATADLTTAIVLTGDAAGLATATADLGGGAAALASDTTATATATADLTTGILLASDAFSVASASASIDVSPGLASDAFVDATALGSLTTAIRLQGAAAADATATGDLLVGALVAAYARRSISRGGPRAMSRGGPAARAR
jgi:hypothetical protein